jgi:signal transduction histidine kinase
MINSLLEVTRIQAGRVEVDIHRVDLRRFVDDLKAGYDAPIGKPITLQWEIASDLPFVRTDSAKLRHILQNLITNSIKYTERGTITISARLVSASGGEDSGTRGEGDTERWVEFAVADTGLGIPQESLPFIFEMFRQVNRPDRYPSSGVGLGLHIVKKFTEILGGEIEVESEVGKGSTFSFTIPC